MRVLRKNGPITKYMLTELGWREVEGRFNRYEYDGFCFDLNVYCFFAIGNEDHAIQEVRSVEFLKKMLAYHIIKRQRKLNYQLKKSLG